MPVGAYANLAWYGPASAAMVVENNRGEVHSVEIRGDLRVGASSDGLGELHYMRPIRLRGFPMDSQGLGEIHDFQPRMKARMALEVAISQLSQDDVVGALQTMPVNSSTTFAEAMQLIMTSIGTGGVDTEALATSIASSILDDPRLLTVGKFLGLK